MGITFVDFLRHVDDENVQAFLELLELDTTDVWTLFKLMDNHNDEVVDADDFVSSCLRLKGYAKGIDLAKLIYDHTFMASRLDRFIKRVDAFMVGMGAGPTHKRSTMDV